MKLDVLKEFNLPSYLEGKSFAQASKSLDNKFKDRDDKISLDTKAELMKRLELAQEAMKDHMGLNDSTMMFFGGNTSSDPLSATDVTGTVGTAANMVAPLLDQETGTVVSGAAQGASAGAVAGPLGAVVGGVLGGGLGLLGNSLNDKKRQQAMVSSAEKANAKHSSDFAYGGKKYNTGGALNDIFKVLPGQLKDPQGPTFDPVQLPEVKDTQSKFNKHLKNVAGKAGNFIKDNYANVLRYAPALMNLKQLNDLEQPDYERLDRMDNRYQKDLVDEAALVNQVQQQADNTRNAIANASTGSVGALRSNLLGAQINSTNALSNAMIQAENINRGENRMEQQFNAGIDRTNINQSNIENDLNARNQGVYDSNRSTLLAQLGNDVGNVGREQRYIKMIEDMGLCYDTNGAYICGTEERVPEDIVQSQSQMGHGGKIRRYYDVLKSKRK